MVKQIPAIWDKWRGNPWYGEIPTDLLETLTNEEAFDIAVSAIRERQKNYHIPARWELVRLDRETGHIRVKYIHS